MTPLLLLLVAALAAPVGAVLLYEGTERRRQRRTLAEAGRNARLQRPGTLSRWLDRALEEARAETLASEHERRELAARSTSRKRLSAKIRASLPDGVWVVAVALLGSAIWGLAVASEVSVDAYGFLGIGYPAALAWALAMLTTLGFSLLGLAIWDLLGATHLLPFVARLRPRIRRALAVSTLLLVVIAMTQLPGLVTHRSEAVAARVRTLQQNVAVLTRTGADPLAISQVRRELVAARGKLRSARYTDQRLAIAAASIEAATSFAAVWLAILAAAWTTSRQAERARRKAAACDLHRMQVEARVRLRLLDRADEADITPDQLQAELDHRARRQRDAAPPPPPPGPQPRPAPRRAPASRRAARSAPRRAPAPRPPAPDPPTSEWHTAL